MQRGVGRGLAATRPAWMTQGSSPLSSTIIRGLKGSSPDKSKSSSNRREDSNGRRRDRSRSRSRSRDRRGRRRSSSSDSREDRRLRTGRSLGGSRASTRRLGSRDDNKYPKSSRSRSPSGSRRNGDNGREATKNGDGTSSYRKQVVRELEATTGLRVGSSQIGRGRGRGLTLPAWMSHPNGVPGGLQQSDVGGDRQEQRQPSPKRFHARSPAPASPEPPAGGGRGGSFGGRGGGRSSSRAGGRYGSPGGGRDGGRSNGRMRENLPEIFSTHKGEVVKTEAFGAFVKLDGYRKHGLVHCSQMAAYRVEDVTDICKVGDRVYVKVIEAIDAADVREQRIGLSMKLVDQSSGADLDPSNAEAETEAQRHRSRGAHGERAPVKPDAVYNTTCTKCEGHGHMSIDCFSRDGKKYDLVLEEDPSDSAAAVVANGGAMRGVRRESPHGSAAAIGRGKQATMPAWMMDLGLDGKLNKKHHRKEKRSKKKSDRKHDRDRKSGGSKDRSRRKESDGSDSDGDRSDDGHKKHHHRHKHKKSKHKKSKHGKQDRRHSEDKGERREDRDQSVGRKHRESASGHDAERRRDDSRKRNLSPFVSRRRRSYSRGRGRGENRDAGGDGRRRDQARRGLGGGRGYDREGQLGDARRGEVGEDGGRWKPRADSDRSESRSTR